MTHIDDISSFMEFDALKPLESDQCIHPTKAGGRCRWRCSDHKRAKELYQIILECQGQDIDTEVLENLILSNCCMMGTAKHRDRIEDAGFLTPLAQRWQNEIRKEHGSASRPELTSAPVAQVALSEFRPHVAQITPDDSVSCKIRSKLDKRDFEAGSLYIFDRSVSPGHVKIGWTAKSVETRLDDWSRCGYTPNLVFSITDIPFAQRVETLTHYELINEWRRERMCKAQWCRKSHCEWFEVDAERAIQVLSGWASFMKAAKPYTSHGLLKPYWCRVIKELEKDAAPVTGLSLLKRHQIHQDKNRGGDGQPVDLEGIIKSEHQETDSTGLEKDCRTSSMKPQTHEKPVIIKQELSPTRTLLPVNPSSPDLVSPPEACLLTVPSRAKSDPSLKVELISRSSSRAISNPVQETQKTQDAKLPLVPTAVKKEPMVKVEEINHDTKIAA